MHAAERERKVQSTSIEIRRFYAVLILDAALDDRSTLGTSARLRLRAFGYRLALLRRLHFLLKVTADQCV